MTTKLFLPFSPLHKKYFTTWSLVSVTSRPVDPWPQRPWPHQTLCSCNHLLEEAVNTQQPESIIIADFFHGGPAKVWLAVKRGNIFTQLPIWTSSNFWPTRSSCRCNPNRQILPQWLYDRQTLKTFLRIISVTGGTVKTQIPNEKTQTITNEFKYNYCYIQSIYR